MTLLSPVFVSNVFVVHLYRGRVMDTQELALKVMEIELPPEVMMHLLDEMSNTEERLAHGGSERLQLGSLVGAFATARYIYRQVRPP